MSDCFEPLRRMVRSEGVDPDHATLEDLLAALIRLHEKGRLSSRSLRTLSWTLIEQAGADR